MDSSPCLANNSNTTGFQVLALGDSFFDSPPEPAFYISNITEWRKEIPTPIVSAEDFSFSSEFQDMHTSDFFELKDTASECSMDSAYQSQSSASRRGARKPEVHRQDSRSRMSSHFVGSDIYSPTMSSDNYSAFPETLDMSQMHQSATSGPWESRDGSLSYANFSTAQDYNQYSTANMTRFTPSTINDSPRWGTEQSFQDSSFNFTSWPAANTSDAMFSSQRTWPNPTFGPIERPATVRNSSSYTQDESRRASAQDTSFGAFVGTPTSTTSAHFPQGLDFEQSHLQGSRNDNEDAKTASAPQSLDGNEDTMSQSENAETKLEEERTKVARSHPLYQQSPDKDGKYHCPEEGKAGCSHKPTALKCNYDKYVDSHLKPFRCNKKTCVGVQFSSTACLLRHEREAHGMHGHGARPHLCHFRDCERAMPGHGFPRRYNLFDHMKRVHQYDGPTTEPSPVQGQAARKSASRKRKASAEEPAEKRVKVVKLTAEQQRQQRRDALSKDFLTKKQHIIDILTNLTTPSDLGDDIQLTKEVVGLHDICTQYRDVFGG
ncbi:hypothetical protein PTNB85_03816 [Pyrenophora teres f. teres]|uniref:Uncharacterized protein n=1 Tax=Pyrenophora teres f. teres TaxID=97479 RepID=A0A6S6W179_9PLEO|nr:hypothetical protein HRS9139_05630 [Pyrenophora teres f. teres]KAE8840417.1 hypothetical protein PTNB85_03816 [Pyrenophora teres f. teres]KAE8863916.1 hypothetical protein PTNB29_03880 [Pyrenophora teres f. teres]CAE7033711.1 hypothetical protein PTTW11_05260 [Pyrenophora teres f. teres]